MASYVSHSVIPAPIKYSAFSRPTKGALVIEARSKLTHPPSPFGESTGCNHLGDAVDVNASR